jgi:hypothetical protein
VSDESELGMSGRRKSCRQGEIRDTARSRSAFAPHRSSTSAPARSVCRCGSSKSKKLKWQLRGSSNRLCTWGGAGQGNVRKEWGVGLMGHEQWTLAKALPAQGEGRPRACS